MEADLSVPIWPQTTVARAKLLTGSSCAISSQKLPAAGEALPARVLGANNTLEQGWRYSNRRQMSTPAFCFLRDHSSCWHFPAGASLWKDGTEALLPEKLAALFFVRKGPTLKLRLALNSGQSNLKLPSGYETPHLPHENWFLSYCFYFSSSRQGLMQPRLAVSSLPHCVSEIDLDVLIFLLLPPQYRESRCIAPHLTHENWCLSIPQETRKILFPLRVWCRLVCPILPKQRGTLHNKEVGRVL